MDKKLILAVAGSGKTTHIVNSLSLSKRSLIVTYTTANYCNLQKKILEKFKGVWPSNITLLSFFSFLYGFCFKPFLSDKFRAKGIFYEQNLDKYLKQSDKRYFFTQSNYIYSNRLSLLMEKENIIADIVKRLESYFDELVIDEVQDIAGRDFSFLEKIMESDVNMLFVGDFFQHTYDTSRDGNVNSSLFDNFENYKQRFIAKGFICDQQTLVRSWRCSVAVCKFVTEKMCICISSNREDDKSDSVKYLIDKETITEVYANCNIIKLHYKQASEFGKYHKNWGEAKGEQYGDTCILLNKKTVSFYKDNRLSELPTISKNKLYVALTRAYGNVYLVDEDVVAKNKT